MPYLDPVVDAKTRGQRRGEEETAVGRPLTMRGVRRVDGRDLVQRPTVVDVDFTSEVAETSDGKKATLWVERDEVAERSTEVVKRPGALIKQHRLGRHDCEFGCR